MLTDYDCLQTVIEISSLFHVTFEASTPIQCSSLSCGGHSAWKTFIYILTVDGMHSVVIFSDADLSIYGY